MKQSFLLMFVLCTLSCNVSFAQMLNGDLNHNGDMDVEDITLLINSYLTGEKEFYNEKRSVIENGHEAVNLGLSVRWATMNIGASAPEAYGDYFAWGETEPKNYYDWSTYKWCNGSYDTMTKYCTRSNYGMVDNKTILELEDDAAHANWGGDWRMPTYEEQTELREKCTWEWTTQNGVNGYKVTASNGNFIFLPAAGTRNDNTLNNAGSNGCYWSSSLREAYSCDAWGLYFISSKTLAGSNNRYLGRSVRPVCPYATR